jgi:hypothetical protein
LGFYTNMVANEMFVDTAQLRASVLSHAKLMNYVPSSKQAATAIVNVKITPSINEDQSSQTLNFARFHNFLSEPLDGKTYNFVNMDSHILTKTGNYFEVTGIELKQGEVVTATFVVDNSNPKRRYTIPSASIDTNTMTVTVQKSVVDTTTTTYTLANDLTEVLSDSTVYFIEENSDYTGTFTVYFGDDIIGKRPIDGNIIIITYLDTQGSEANKANSFSSIENIGGYSDNVIITSVSAAAGGAEKETIEQIRFRAPIHYSVQNRAVTKNDFESLILKDYPNIDSVSVWGGEDNDPVVYGKVFISLKPVENYFISLAEKERIVEEIISNRSIMTVTPEIVDPDYVYMLVNAKVYYDGRITAMDEGEIKALVRQAVLDYKEESLQTFSSTYRSSVLRKKIDVAEKSIKSSELSVYLQKRFEPVIGESRNYTLSFNTPLYRGSFNDKLYSYPAATVNDLAGVERNVYFEEIPESYTGVDSIDVTNPGMNYSVPPTVTITGDGTGATAVAKIVNGKITQINIVDRGINYTKATVTISGDGTGGTATAVLQNRIGTLRTFYYRSNGEKVIVNPSAGTIDYDKGTIIITNFVPLALVTNSNYANDTMTFNIKPLNETLYPLRNRIIDIDENDSLSITVTAVNEN